MSTSTWDPEQAGYGEELDKRDKDSLAHNIISLHGGFLHTGDSRHPHPIKNDRKTMDLLPKTHEHQRLHL